MKMLFIIYSKEADEEIIGAFKRSGMRWYTKMEEVRGEGKESEPKLGTHIWPGLNNMLLVVIEDAEVGEAKDIIKRMKNEHPRAGLKGLLIPLEDCI